MLTLHRVGRPRHLAVAWSRIVVMLELMRTVRFAVGPDVSVVGDAGVNGFAGRPMLAGLGAHYELDIKCRGGVDTATGYFLNIKLIDEAARAGALPIIADAFGKPGADPASLLVEILSALDALLPGLRSVRWRLTPTYSMEMERSAMSHVEIRQSFEFAASHRLYVPTLSEEENFAVFGKCTNPAGHGHNYRVEPCVRVAVGDEGAGSFTLRDLERLTNERLIEHLDHKHLNSDVPEFVALNPSVENIARVCYERLAPAVEAAGARLEHVTVWETEKTSCVYPAPTVG